MTSSNKLSTAVKALTYLGKEFPVPKSSSEISEAIGVNASKLRQILSSLCKAEIVASVKGTQGGFVLLQDFTSLSLYEIYAALDEKKIIDMDVAKANNNETKQLNDYFNHFFWSIQKEIEDRMKTIKLNEISDNLENNSRKE